MFSWPPRSALFHLGGRTAEVAANLHLSRTSPAVKQEDPLPVSASPGTAGSACGEPGESSASRGGGSQPCAAPCTAICVRPGRLSRAGHAMGTQRARRVRGETLSGAARGGEKAGPFDLGTGWGLLGNGQWHCALPLPSNQHQGERKKPSVPHSSSPGREHWQQVPSGAARLAERSGSLRAASSPGTWTPIPVALRRK